MGRGHALRIVSAETLSQPPALPEDGRQSVRALAIRRGVGRLMRRRGCAVIPEVTLDNGRRADLVALCPKGGVTIVEIKSSVADFRADTKWPDYLGWCDSFFFATGLDVPQHIFPEEAGLIVADGFGADILRDAPESAMRPAARKSLLVLLARAGAFRLHDLEDPQSLRFEG